MVPGDAERGLQLADLVNDDLARFRLAGGGLARTFALGTFRILGVGGGDHQMQIRVVARQPPQASLTMPAGLAVGGGRVAQQPRSERLRQQTLSQPWRADEKQRVRQTLAEIDKAHPGGLQPGRHHAKKRSASRRSISAWMRSGGRSASITHTRCGALRARSR